MNYAKVYDDLVRTRKNRIPVKGEYYEKHHILMRAMGGLDTKENIVIFTAREHFLAHRLLSKIFSNSSDAKIRKSVAYAFFAMCKWKNKEDRTGNRYVPSSREYAEARELYSKERSVAAKGKTWGIFDEKRCKDIADKKRKIWNSLSLEEKKNRIDNSFNKLTKTQISERASKGTKSFFNNFSSEEKSKIVKSRINLTPEERSARSKKAGKTYWSKLTPEQRKERIKKMHPPK